MQQPFTLILSLFRHLENAGRIRDDVICANAAVEEEEDDHDRPKCVADGVGAKLLDPEENEKDRNRDTDDSACVIDAPKFRR